MPADKVLFRSIYQSTWTHTGGWSPATGQQEATGLGEDGHIPLPSVWLTRSHVELILLHQGKGTLCEGLSISLQRTVSSWEQTGKPDATELPLTNKTSAAPTPQPQFTAQWHQNIHLFSAKDMKETEVVSVILVPLWLKTSCKQRRKWPWLQSRFTRVPDFGTWDHAEYHGSGDLWWRGYSPYGDDGAQRRGWGESVRAHSEANYGSSSL